MKNLFVWGTGNMVVRFVFNSGFFGVGGDLCDISVCCRSRRQVASVIWRWRRAKRWAHAFKRKGSSRLAAVPRFGLRWIALKNAQMQLWFIEPKE